MSFENRSNKRIHRRNEKSVVRDVFVEAEAGFSFFFATFVLFELSAIIRLLCRTGVSCVQ
jgi:hypothetical protein